MSLQPHERTPTPTPSIPDSPRLLAQTSPDDAAGALSLSAACRLALMGVVFALVLSLALSPRAADAQQMRYMTGQNVVPVFEGWERNADGSFNMVFGYMNRNYEEEVDVPVGPDNKLEPLDADQGQPAHFYARRQQFMFKVRVP